jgi:8-amino-7-oxononanoate synthase
VETSLSLQTELKEVEARHAYRRRRTVEQWISPDAQTVAIVDGAEKTVFCSNDYLGLARHPQVMTAFEEGARQWGAGSGASHLITGHTRVHHELEEALAEFTGRERALLFSTGYMANLGVASALLSRGDIVFEDRLNHASLLDAGLLSGARLSRYPHADFASLSAKLGMLLPEQVEGESVSTRRAFIMTDGVFSMDGDVAPLPGLAQIARTYGAWLMVDDAHGIGVLGARGRGTLEALEVGSREVPVLMGTLGKALGTSGAFVAGSNELIELLIQKARTYIYTTALPPAVAAATLVALKLVDQESWRRSRVLAHVQRFRAAMTELKIPLMESSTPIQPVLLGSAENAVKASEALWARGLWVSAIRPPTVPEGSARLRITFSAAHSDAQVDCLIEALSHIAPLMSAS